MQYLKGMAQEPEFVAEEFLRNFRDVFSVRDMNSFLNSCGIRSSSRETASFLDSHPLVFPLEGGMYITRAGAFTDRLFSIKPTAREVEQGAFVPAGRCLPFVDSEMTGAALSFSVAGHKLPAKIVNLDSDFAIDLYILYGEEYAPQYIAADPANADLDMVRRDFELPATVRLTGIDISYLVEHCGFALGDRLLCRVTDWNSGAISCQVVHESHDRFGTSDAAEQRRNWYVRLEEMLLQSFSRLGPCATMEEQVANVFFEHRNELCTALCGSLDEYFASCMRKVAITSFGVETRLWKKGVQIPAVGEWNRNDLDSMYSHLSISPRNAATLYTFPDFVLDEYILDMLYRRSTDFEALFMRMYAEHCPLNQSQKKKLLLHLNERHGIIASTYNWFADQGEGSVRQDALELYGKVALLVYKIDSAGFPLEKYPQQELIILSQLYSHITRMIEQFADGMFVEEEADTLRLSIEGMRWNYEDIAESLEQAVRRQHISSFKVVK
ncbi:MAG: hypothetical protein J1D88_09300 [Treponema sp.]|nr:hypothetical protein [Treponema sp.]